ncbi:long-chain-fatty-acid--CoA ligase [Desulfoscipio gibsoniae]|uniref:Acyl-CoA synthetase (AMP-forming)/AMP-acid ligase II n=1 Tax=Desulfoscipio gibsoniae DSM 7213 TaxID=767817 RepID=R4KP80_9FIRM|nr:long-chain fatty acid--CoA ligase [Desulfoscipio gibsoniae]AGL03367.1 acyl-CoA synthetase (AMP-forming)/AMP-acid ligase II [Desulfoscipio gibsoniae DSM 7213]
MFKDDFFWCQHYPQGVPHRIEIPNVSLYYFLEQAAQKYPAHTATIFMGHKLTFSRLKEQVDRLATALNDLGVKKGDRVAVMLPNCPQTVIAYYAIVSIGGVVVMTNPLYMERELLHQLRDAEAETLIYLDAMGHKVLNMVHRTRVKNLIVTGVQDYLPFPLNYLYPIQAKKQGQVLDAPGDRGVLHFKKFLQKYSPRSPRVQLDPENDLALLQYTGGTTGLSKGVMLTHKNLVANVKQVHAWLTDCRDAGERMLGALPFFHVFGMTVVMNFAIYCCSTMILLPRFQIDTVLKQINKYHPTLFPGAPTMYVAVVSHPELNKYDISSIKACISGAAPLPVEVQEKFERLTGGKLVEGYGLTESSPVTHCNPINGDQVSGSIGQPLPNTDVKIMDNCTGTKEMPLGEVGELCIRGPQVMKGYWNMPEETARTIRDGWLYTGDIARMDERGFTYVVDRKKDIVIAGGYNIYPREVEEVLYGHAKVKEVVVAGVPDTYRGETLKAYIVLKEGEKATEQEIINYCTEQLVKYKVPRKVEFRYELPKTMVGKILRRALVEEERSKLEENNK